MAGPICTSRRGLLAAEASRASLEEEYGPVFRIPTRWATERTDRYNRSYWMMITWLGEKTRGAWDLNTIHPFPAARETLGIRPDLSSTKSLRIAAVEPLSPADSAGLRAGDVIESVNDVNITSYSDLLEVIKNSQASSARVVFTRQASSETAIVHLDSEGQRARTPFYASQRSGPVGYIEAVRNGNSV